MSRIGPELMGEGRSLTTVKARKGLFEMGATRASVEERIQLRYAQGINKWLDSITSETPGKNPIALSTCQFVGNSEFFQHWF